MNVNDKTVLVTGANRGGGQPLDESTSADGERATANHE